MTNYIIINSHCTAYSYGAETYSEVIFNYAESVGITIDLSIFKKALMALNIEESVTLFNDVCCAYEDKIALLLSGYNTLYKRG